MHPIEKITSGQRQDVVVPSFGRCVEQQPDVAGKHLFVETERGPLRDDRRFTEGLPDSEHGLIERVARLRRVAFGPQEGHQAVARRAIGPRDREDREEREESRPLIQLLMRDVRRLEPEASKHPQMRVVTGSNGHLTLA